MACRSNLVKDLIMEAFVVFTREETTDPHELATYSAGVGPSFDGHDVSFLAAYGAMEQLEGPPVEGAVILRFPSMQAAQTGIIAPPTRPSPRIALPVPATAASSSRGGGETPTK